MDPQTESQLQGDSKACPRCGAEHRADLREEAVLEQLKTIDEALVRAPGPVARLAGRTAAAVAMVGLGGAAVAGMLTFVQIFLRALFDNLMLFKNIAGLAFLGAIGMIAGLYGLVGFAYPAFKRLGAKRRALPVRWHDSPEPAAHSPLTGRACTAYDIGVRLDDDTEAAAGTWLLRETQGCIDLPLRRIEVDPFTDGVAHFLRARGIDPMGQDLVFFEALSTADDRTLAPAPAAVAAIASAPAASPPGDAAMRRAFAL